MLYLDHSNSTVLIGIFGVDNLCVVLELNLQNRKLYFPTLFDDPLNKNLVSNFIGLNVCYNVNDVLKKFRWNR